MGVFVKAECEMAERFGGVAGLLEGTKHKVGDDALFGLADNLFNQALIVLRGDAQVASRERDFTRQDAASESLAGIRRPWPTLRTGIVPRLPSRRAPRSASSPYSIRTS